MKPCLQSFLFPVGLACLLAAGPARAADSDLAKVVVVQSVSFGPAQAPDSTSGAWDEADVSLLVTPAPTQPWADRVKITLTVAFTVEGKPKTYRASAEAVALESGSPHFRFYLPPEVVKEYKLPSTPNFYVVEISVGGAKLPGKPKNVSSSITTAEQLKNILAGGGENNGVLLPQYLSPFARDSGKAAPSFIRPEAGSGGSGGSSSSPN